MVNSEKVSFVRQRLENGASVEKVKADLVSSGMPQAEIESTMQNAISSLLPETVTHTKKKWGFLRVMGLLSLLIIIGLSVYYIFALHTGKVNTALTASFWEKAVIWVINLKLEIFG